jgi:hypothetical protein
MLSRFADDANDIILSPDTRAGQVPASTTVDASLARWEQEQLFEEDVRAVLNMLRPNRAERLLGWSEYRTGGNGFRATISWDPGAPDAPLRRKPGHGASNPADGHFVIPQMTDVLESILVGSLKNADEMEAKVEFELYRDVVRELGRRLDEMQRCYE